MKTFEESRRQFLKVTGPRDLYRRCLDAYEVVCRAGILFALQEDRQECLSQRPQQIETKLFNVI